ncbi:MULTISPECIES: MinD/ParA family protein [Microbacterium]|uniref:nucleotide-binding protein n=1 Tax=Microbacterium TaxID=33882 RepID=UPI00277E19A0|nr:MULTISPECIES: MinD/ParA family protein [Microbacterium]MDQ1083612.1 MinD-like ATPase involved in chromosome partitioning or flagellar assembly [Microbacterium sp. SORGH_AS_0344]MDQ1171112.1 MinD-like ATPase involved in chromosome partitioning or flagellar assembly [Microbacterium proteolyticum]
MTPDRTDANHDEDAEHGVLDESGNLDTASITILGGHIAQVNVDLPVTTDDDVDDDVIEDEIPIDDVDLPLLEVPSERHDHGGQGEVIHAAHIETLPTGDIILEPHDDDADGAAADDRPHDTPDVVLVDHGPVSGDEHHDVHDAELVEDDHESGVDAESVADGGTDAVVDLHEEPFHDGGTDHPGDHPGDGAISHLSDGAVEPGGADVAQDADRGHGPADADSAADDDAPGVSRDDEDRARDLDAAEVVEDVEMVEADAASPVDDWGSAESSHEPSIGEGARGADESSDDDASDAFAEALTRTPWVAAPTPARTDAGETSAAGPDAGQADDAVGMAGTDIADTFATEPATAQREDEVASVNEADPDDAAAARDESTTTPTDASAEPAPASPADPVTAPVSATTADTGAVEASPAATDAVAAVAPPAGTGPVPATRAERAATGAIGTIPLTRRSAQQADEAARAAEETARVDRAHAMERVRTPAPEVTLTSKRIGEIDDARESSDLLTADRLLDPRQISKPEPEGLWQQLLYSVSGHRINLGDGRKARQRKELDRRISAPLVGGARFVPVLSRKGGVGKTTVTSLLGMALADARDDRIIAVDANPDRGTLADRVGRPNGRTVRDLVRSHDDVAGYHDVSSIVARDATRLDVLASDADPRVSEAFSDDDYRQVADVAAHYYSIVLTDTGTGIVHSVMGATLELADTIVIVAGLSVDEARLASETLTWLETNGYASRVRDAVVVLNNSRPGTPLVRESELEAHFRSRVRTVIRMPYDARIAAGSAIAFRDLQPTTRQAARELAAAVVEGLRSPVAAA